MITALRLCTVLCFLCSSCFAAQGDIYWIRPEGTQTIWANCRSSSSPADDTASYCTVATAFANATAGELVYFRGGTYIVPQHTSGNTYDGVYNFSNSGTGDADSERIIFKAYPGEIPVFDGTIGGAADGDHCFTRIMATKGKDYITIDGFKLTVSTPGGTYNAGFPSMVIGGDSGTSVGITIKNCVFEAYNAVCDNHDNNEGIRLEYANDTIIARNKIYNYNATIAGNTFGACGIQSYRTNRMTVENNEIYNCSTAFHQKSYGTYHTYRYNYFHDNQVTINISTNTGYQRNGQVYHNIFSHFTNAGLEIYGSDQDINNWSVHHNTIYSAKNTNSGNSALLTKSAYGGTNFYVYDNIIDAKPGSYSVSYRLGGVTGVVLDYNNYSSPMAVLCLSSTLATLGALQAATCISMGPNTHDMNSISGDSIFVNASGSLSAVADFALTPTSPGYLAGDDGLSIGANTALVGLLGGLGTYPATIHPGTSLSAHPGAGLTIH